MPYQASRPQRRVADMMARYRDDLHLTHRDVNSAVGLPSSTLTRLERADARFDLPVLRALSKLYNLDDQTTEHLCEMSQVDRSAAWWPRYGRWLTPSYIDFLRDETDARRITSIQTMYVPGLLQTLRYTQAVVAAGPAESPDRSEAQVEVRQKRRQKLDDPDLEYSAIIAESALHWQFGGVEVQREQLKFIRSASELSNVSIRILAFSCPASTFAADFFEFDPDDAEDALVYSEDQWGTPHYADQLALRQARREIQRLELVALPEDESVALVEQLIRSTQ